MKALWNGLLREELGKTSKARKVKSWRCFFKRTKMVRVKVFEENEVNTDVNFLNSHCDIDDNISSPSVLQFRRFAVACVWSN